MKLVLTVYTDEALTEIKRVCEADKLRIPYRVAMYIAQALEGLDFKNEDELFKFITGSLDKVDKIVKATFGVTDTELECVDVTELGAVVMEVYRWGIDKLNSIKGDDSKNVEMTA